MVLFRELGAVLYLPLHSVHCMRWFGAGGLVLSVLAKQINLP